MRTFAIRLRFGYMAETIKFYFSQNINHLIQQKNLTYMDVKNETGIPTATLADWRTGRIPRDLVKVKKLSLYLNITLDDLLFSDLKK